MRRETDTQGGLRCPSAARTPASALHHMSADLETDLGHASLHRAVYL